MACVNDRMWRSDKITIAADKGFDNPVDANPSFSLTELRLVGFIYGLQNYLDADPVFRLPRKDLALKAAGFHEIIRTQSGSLG
jgi:hypothetical protein